MPVPAENTNGFFTPMTSSVDDNCGSNLAADDLHGSYHSGSDPSLLHFPISNVQMYNNENMILVQVNPGETFTIQGADGTYRSISGPAQVPMVSHDGAIPPIYVPPGYVSQVIEQNGVRRVIVLPCAGGVDDQPSFMVSPSVPQPHPQIQMHGLQQAHMHPGMLHQNMVPNCRPDETFQLIPQPMYVPDEMSLSALQRYYSSPEFQFPAMAPVPSSSHSCTSSHLYCQPLSQCQFPSESHLDLASLEPVDVSLASLGSDFTAQPAHLKVRYCTFRHYANTEPSSQPCVYSTESISEEPKLPYRPFESQSSLLPIQEKKERPFNDYVHTNTRDLSDSSLSSVQQCSSSSDIQNTASSLPHLPAAREKFPNTLQSHQSKPLQSSKESSTLSTSSMNSSPASSSSFASPGGSPETLINSTRSNKHKLSYSPVRLATETSPMSLDASGHVANSPKSKSNSSLSERKPLTSTPPATDDGQTSDTNDEQSPQDIQSYQTISELVAAIRAPKVRDITPRSAKVVWGSLPVQSVSSELKLKTREFSVFYDLDFSRGKKDGGKYRSVFSGKECRYSITDLRPASEYSVRLFATCNNERGPASGVTSFKTLSCRPDVPAAPKLQSKTKSNLVLKWTAPTDNGEKIQKYHLEMNEAENGSGFRLVAAVSQKQFKVQKLIPSTAYVFRLAAENKLGKSNWSGTVRFYTAGTVPSLPEAPRLTKAMISSLSLEWIKPQGEVSGYTLEMNDESTGYGFRPVYDGADLKFLIKDLTRNSHYKFRLLAYNNEGKSKHSEVVSYRTCPDKPKAPGKPQVQGNVHARSFKLCWDAPKDSGGAAVNEYIMEMSKEKGGPMDVIYTGPEPECLVENLNPGHTYRLRVFCLTTGGNSMPSEVVQVTTHPVLPGSCDPPMLAMRPKSTCLFIKWEPPAHTGGASIQEYELNCIATLEDDKTQPSQAYKGPDLQCTVGTLRPATKYSFSVRPANKVGLGPWSNSLEAVTSAGTPQKPSVPKAIVLSPSSIHLQWIAPECNGAEITNYILQWGGTEEAMSGHMTGPVLTYEAQHLNPNSTYYYSIQAVNNVGQSPSSEVGFVTTPASCPSAVENLRLCDVTDDADNDEIALLTTTASQIAIQWDKPNDNGSDITGYKIHISGKKSNENAPGLLEIDGSLLHHCVQNLDPDTEYSMKVCATNDLGCGCFSRSLKAKTKPLPPDAPGLTCAQMTSSSLKLQWRDRSRFPEGTQFLLQMRDKHGRFSTAYRGSNASYKVTRLSENATYRFRINASNSEGVGHFSQEYVFQTRPQLPPMLEAPTISSVQTTLCHVTWPKIDSIKGDAIHYTLSLGKLNDPSFSVVFPCEATSYRLDNLASHTAYTVRVAAIRRCTSGRFSQSLRDDSSTCSEVTDDGPEVDLTGPLSNPVTFSTLRLDDDDTDVVEEPTLSYLPQAPLAGPKTQTSASEHLEAVKDAPLSGKKSENDVDPESWLSKNMATVLIAFYFLSAIIIAYSLQSIYVK